MVQNLGDKRIGFPKVRNEVNYTYDSWSKSLSITGSHGKNMYAYCESG